MFSSIAKSSTILSRSSFRLFLRAQSTNALTKTQLPFAYSPTGPASIKYTTQHEWLATHSDKTTFLGITKYAADALGDATYIELPEIDTEVEAGDSISSVESVKSASEIYFPIKGTVVEVNENLIENPQLINIDPMGSGWIAKIKIDDEKDLVSKDLLELEQYENYLKNHTEE
ncbi:hypothetical protein TBLA_0E00670 [Henningerozyma blattae CBS 6284]|uniref:Glycine cleavage system H protein n=1 Tax=Henningerozyma blattae (strain ATCC 34711 / CBS 6284 / DSM 70876 / NBRC 10599 / NRRL Y-10934 / UCD 77-7) TaxID=1071380 RepID=I2H426_HENB6|nr:hypothetical protein TBLA_0E00670 [Tetrapisispora blattae CBS 6284]CCH61128.1 hypothetical protein TBLA_0E00670 [Tetrapisispora blattae CBS 6284]